MARFRPGLLRLLALLLFVQAGVAGAACLSALGGHGAQAVEICTADGKRLVHLDAEGQPVEAPAPAPVHAGFCPACLVPSTGLPAPPPAIPARAAPSLPVSFAPVAAAEAPPAALRPPYPGRAPPAQV
ncbi:MAG: hypothetical protein MUF65_11725 [Rubritepida sp.]|jgi:hypothetical protein|nr:hypothetical protein [Rubritepida sp.]MCU0946023.1 hypothetical protein [Rubritepida sp.]